MEITVNHKRIMLDKAVRLVDLPDVIGFKLFEDGDGFFISDNDKLLYSIPEDSVTEDGHTYLVFATCHGG